MGKLTWLRGAYGVLLLCVTTAIASPAQTFKILYSFCSGSSDGANPSAGLVQATNGKLYGTTSSLGVGDYGTVFQINASGTSFMTLHPFSYSDGAYPYAGLVQDTDGKFYGTTEKGGANGDDYGTVFQITPSGALTTLHSFDGTDGAYPTAGLVQATNGNLYGTTKEGGANKEGTIFKITPSRKLTTLHSFDGTDGADPLGALVQATDGNLYGTTVAGGANGYGTVFRITPSGTLTTLHRFDLTDGAAPYAGLVQDTNGNLYGTTYYGGESGCGTVFGLSVGLGPFVETLPTSGKVGTAVKILGTNLTGATGVSFNGTAAKFKVVSSSEITTTVPGATTGTVEVKTPRGTLKSNVVFRVTP
jgi:uncharacterized repeat protein (TIGR03803 family)